MTQYHVRHVDHMENIDWQCVPMAGLTNFLWLDNGFCPPTFAQLAWTNDALAVRLFSHETHPVRTLTHHQDMVCMDSCLEFFVNFMPVQTTQFFNFEVNPNGAMLSAFGPPRDGRTPLDLTHWAKEMHITPVVQEGLGWGVTYQIPWRLVAEFEPGFVPEKDRVIVGNFFKCGENAPVPHYGTWNRIDVAQVNFHRPEFFAPLIFD